MRKVAVMVLMAIAAMSFAQEMEEVGGWMIYHTKATLLDSAFTVAVVRGADGALLMVTLAPEVRVAVAFPDFLATENEMHDKTVLFVTNQIDARRLTGGWRQGVKAVRWSGATGQAILDDIARATEMVFRTYDYRNNKVDAIFDGLSPEGTTLMLAELRTR